MLVVGVESESELWMASWTDLGWCSHGNGGGNGDGNGRRRRERGERVGRARCQVPGFFGSFSFGFRLQRSVTEFGVIVPISDALSLNHKSQSQIPKSQNHKITKSQIPDHQHQH